MITETTKKPLYEETSLKNKLDEIALFFLTFTDYSHPSSIMGGDLGVAIFLSKYGKYAQDEQYIDKAIEIVSNCFDFVEKQFVPGSFCNGLAGVGWSLRHMISNGLIEGDADLLTKGLENIIYQNSLQFLGKGEYDYMHMGSGGLLYALEASNDQTTAYLEKAVITLSKTAKQSGDLCFWQHDPSGRIAHMTTSNPSYNLGLSHGIPSLIVLLSHIYEAGHAMNECKKLVRNSINWLLANKLPDGYNSIYASMVSEGRPNIASRLGWCYGDPGIAMALLQAGSIFNEPLWTKEGTELLLHSAQRRDLVQNMIRDATICHGTSGLAQIFYRGWLQTQEPLLLSTSNFWLDQTLQMANRPQGFCGYQASRRDGHENVYSVLEGIAGIGLVFLNRLEEDLPTWDRMLLIS